MSLEVPADQDLLRIYGAGTGGMDRTSYDGWAALWLAGYREGAMVRPPLSKDEGVVSAWREYHGPNPSIFEFQAFESGYAYGKGADTTVKRIPGWVVPLGVAFGAACFTIGLIVGVFF